MRPSRSAFEIVHTLHDTGISRHIGTYSDGVEASPGLRWLFSSGTPGYAPDGTLPEGIAAQSRQAWTNVFDLLAKAG